MAGPTVEILGHVSDEERGSLMSKAKYVIVSALEDYGLVPVEANANGTPVVCFGAGGVLDTQVPRKTGLFFNPQESAALAETLVEADTIEWNPADIRDHALSNFSQKVFFEKIDQVLEDFCAKHELGALVH